MLGEVMCVVHTQFSTREAALTELCLSRALLGYNSSLQLVLRCFKGITLSNIQRTLIRAMCVSR